MNTQKPSGIGCPVCTSFIHITITDLLQSDGVICNCCGLVLTIDKKDSQTALDALAKVQQAEQRLRATEKFQR